MNDRGDGRIPGLGERPAVTFTFAGRPVPARAGDTVAMALWAAGVRVLRHSNQDGADRAVFCNMGVCFECLVQVDGATQRACTTVVHDGMQVLPGGKP